MNEPNAVLERLKPRELQPRLELQVCSEVTDCGCGISGCCPYVSGICPVQYND